MDPSYISALSGLAGAAIGGFTSISTAWVSQFAQFRERTLAGERAKREKLFGDFVTEASRLYGDALTHERDDIKNLVELYAMVSKMRLLASEAVVASAERTMDIIVETYLSPNRGLQEFRDAGKKGELNFLRDFADLCRAELNLIRPRRHRRA
ncbi:MAG: hypothetical protein WDM86_00165 [Rhizomicrobium sp.]